MKMMEGVVELVYVCMSENAFVSTCTYMQHHKLPLVMSSPLTYH